jgi:hypothetical protein
MIRLRQVALVAHELEQSTDILCERLGLSVCFRDPAVEAFGLHNTLFTVGDQFLEIVSPMQPGTGAGRLLDKRSTDVAGYMAVYEVDDLDERDVALTEAGVRIVWRGDLPDIRARHLHPHDVGGAMVSIDQPVPQGAWPWAGPSWVAHSDASVVTAIAGIDVAANDPDAMRRRWHQLGLDHAVRFTEAGEHGEGIDGVDLVAADRSRVGEHWQLGVLTFRLV